MEKSKKVFVTVLFVLMGVVACLGVTACGKHEHVYTETVVKATCTEQGYTLHVCSCGDEYSDSYTDALGHEYGEWISNGNGTHTKTCAKDSSHKITENCHGGTATCTEKATCSDCGGKYGELKEHDYSTLKQSATHHWYECACGAKNGETAHTPSAAATETTDQVCTVCRYVITPATGHIHTNHLTKTEAKSATCTQTGNTEYYVCSCGKWFTDSTATTEITDKDSVIIAKTQHAFTRQVADDKYIATSATCTSKATYYYSCVCGEKGTDTFEYGSALGHSYGEWINAVDATCESDGTKGHYTCSACGKYFDQNKAELSDLTVKGGHVYGEWINAVDATCESDGTKGHYTCSACGKNFDQNKAELSDLVIPAGHYYIGGVCSGCGEKKPSEGLSFTLKNGYYSIAGMGSCLDTDIVIPSTYNNKPVKSINDYAFLYCDSLTSVTIPDSVISIGGYAFEYCSKLTSVTIGNGVARIGGYALHGCSSLTSIIIPDSVTSIGGYAFEYCSSLTSVTIGNSVTSIGSRAFYGCGKLKSIAIGNGLTSIEKGMLSGCGSLEEITIPFVGAIAGKSSIDTYQYPFGYIFGTNSYTGGTATEQFYYGSSTSSPTKTIYYIPSGLKKVTVTGSNILYGAFNNCTSLTSVTIGNSVTSIGDSAFYNCTSLTSVTIGNSVTSIGNSVFYNCTSLTSITIPNSVTSIGSSVFHRCLSLTSVTIGNSVTSIGWYAFYGCLKLTSIVFKSPNNWYRTSSSYNWRTETGGTKTSLSDSSQNATYFTSKYEDYYWYKK